MKRLAAMLVVLVSLFTFAYADMPDISGLSDDEIVELLHLVNSEIANRKIEKTATLPAGNYVVGKDIPSGSYIATVKHTVGFTGSTLEVFDSQGTTKTCFMVFPSDYPLDVVKEEGSWKIALDDGDLYSCDAESKLTVYTGIVFE